MSNRYFVVRPQIVEYYQWDGDLFSAKAYVRKYGSATWEVEEETDGSLTLTGTSAWSVDPINMSIQPGEFIPRSVDDIPAGLSKPKINDIYGEYQEVNDVHMKYNIEEV